MPSRVLKKQHTEQDTYSAALARVRHVFDMFEHVAVSFSGGKDSTATMNLALTVAKERKRLPLRVFTFDEEVFPMQVEDYMRRVSKRPDVAFEWYCVPIKHRNACSLEHPFWYPWAEEDRERWVRPMPPEAITHIEGYDGTHSKDRLGIPELVPLLFGPERGMSCMLLGIRTDESITRYRAVARRENDNYIIKMGKSSGFGTAGREVAHLYKAYPIYDWSVQDVWTAPKIYGWDYCRYYDVLEMLGIPPASQRLAPPFGEEPFRQLSAWAATFPDDWAKMCMRVPGANTAAMYSTTELYSYGDTPQKPDDVTWQEFIVELLRRHPLGAQSVIAERLKSEITSHYRRTRDPILPDTGHPLTGASWNFFVMIAVRGDLKKRKDMLANKGKQEVYDAERKAIAAGLSDKGTRY